MADGPSEGGRRTSPRGGPTGLRVDVTDGDGRPVRAPGLGRWLVGVAPRRARGQMTIAFVSDRRMRALNKRFRGVDRTTDVLTFPNADPGGPSGPGSATHPEPFLGDVVIATGRAARQSRAAGHSPQTEHRILALHGLLHLLGYDHGRDQGQMARVERMLRRRGGLEAGLIERTARGQRP